METKGLLISNLPLQNLYYLLSSLLAAAHNEITNRKKVATGFLILAYSFFSLKFFSRLASPLPL
jgi:hypothetical protein